MTVMRTRARDLKLPLPGMPGPHNAITDVPGVEVGFSTIKSLAAAPGDRQIYTGVTAVLPRGHARTPMPVWAGQFDLNGNGEMTGAHWVDQAGFLEVTRMWPGPLGMKGSISAGSSALSKMSSQRAYGYPRRSVSRAASAAGPMDSDRRAHV